MGAQQAVQILYRDTDDAVRTARQAEFEAVSLNPYVAAERGYVDAVIDPAGPGASSPAPSPTSRPSGNGWVGRSTATCHCDHGCAGDGVRPRPAGRRRREGDAAGRGSAADAAVAAGAVLAVTFQHMCGMGGDLFALVHDGTAVAMPQRQRPRRIGRRRRPAARPRALTRCRCGDHIAAVTIPGCVDGWLALHGRHGRLPLADVLAPAVGYAATVSRRRRAGGRVPSIADRPGAGDYAAAPARAPGTIIRRPGVARTLAAIAAAAGRRSTGASSGRADRARRRRVHR